MSTRARRSTSTGGLVGTPAPVKHVAPDPVTLEEITEETARQMATDVIDWAICHGLAMRTTDHLADNGGVVEFAPITLLPTKLDADIFAEAMAIQKVVSLHSFIRNFYNIILNSKLGFESALF